jgi:hypothetical protein
LNRRHRYCDCQACASRRDKQIADAVTKHPL